MTQSNDIQMDIPHPRTNLPTGHPPASPASPRNTDCSSSQNAGEVPQPEDSGPQSTHLGSQTGCTGLSDAYQGPPAGNLDPQGAYQSSQAGSTAPEASSPDAIPASFPVQTQPKCNCPNLLREIPWMPAPLSPPNGPPGLEYLSQADLILIHQQIKILEILTGYECNNKYEIKNNLGQRVYFAAEDTSWAWRICCGRNRLFTLKIHDNLGREVLTVDRSLRCTSCCFPSCLQQIEIQAPPGVPIGYVSQECHFCDKNIIVQNEKREDVLKIIGFCVSWRFCTDFDFEVTSFDEKSVVGKISKHWSGYIQELFTKSDNFSIKFHVDLDVKTKALVLCACLFIDFIYFENNRIPFLRWL
ncbi:PREDICTED: phospholipid scramblase 2-like isoform X2 [Chinchilla lanigera]|uniref:phospholipid scramblase 2-like isoform X2 n=1 Tax=Chinchilla lanigera TaxID=34839 RepID=UPI00038EE228|nr:PREDICTED: phospholipid scramblase 2-like isoform X2 [Chinchilla lanigera]